MLRRFLETGRVVNTHGLTGEVRVQPWCDTPEFLTQFEGFYFGEGTGYRRVLSVRAAKSLALLRFEGVEDVTAAAQLVRSVLYIDRAWVTLPEGTWFEQDLLGLRVEDAGNGRVYGTLGEVGRTGANDIYRVDAPSGSVWIPAIPSVVRQVDPEGGRMLISPLKGLFEDAD